MSHSTFVNSRGCLSSARRDFTTSVGVPSSIATHARTTITVSAQQFITFTLSGRVRFACFSTL